MRFPTEELVRHVQDLAYLERPFITDFAAAPQAAARFGEQLYFGVLGYEQQCFADARTMLTLAAGHAEPGSDAALFYLGMAQARLGDERAAFGTLLSSFTRSQRLPPALFEAARLALRLGDEGTAVALFRQLIAVSGDAPHFRRALDLAQLHAYNQALAAVSPRVAGLMAPCALLGAAGPALAPRHDKLIGALLDGTREDWERQAIPAPRHAGRWALQERPAQPLRVLQVFARYTNCSQRYVDNEFLHHFHQSASERGHESRAFFADKILYGPGAVPPHRVIDGLPFEPSAESLRAELDALREAIDNFRPDLVMFEGNFLPADTTITPAFFTGLPNRRSFRLVVVLPDLYDTAPDFLGAWVGVADRVLCFNEDNDRFAQQRASGKMVYFPSLPFGNNPDAFGEKRHDFVFAGGLTRQRDAVLACIARHVPGARIVGSGRERDGAFPSVAEFNHFLAQGKVTFNTGYLDALHPAIQTGRVVEAMLARTALLEESSTSVARCFVPHLHYMPVANGAQAVAFTQFLASHEAHRQAMVDAALKMVREHYSPAHFWSAIESSL